MPPEITRRLPASDREHCVGDLPLFKKVRIAIGLLKNPAAVVLDKLRLRKSILYETRSGLRFRTRAGTTDINEAIVVLAGEEYPPALLDVSNSEAPVVIDCGGHIGTFTLLVKTLNGSARIYAIEPLQENLRLLKENLQLNGIADVTVVEKALHARRGPLSLYVTEVGFDSATTSSPGTSRWRKINVEATTLEDIVNANAIAAIDLLKMDVEGSEYEIIGASFPLLREKARRIIMEYHLTAAHHRGRDELVSQFTSNGDFSLLYETKNLLAFHNRRFT